MACELLMGRRIRLCGAVREQVALSLEELQTICQTDRYHTCTIYQEHHDAQRHSERRQHHGQRNSLVKQPHHHTHNEQQRHHDEHV